MRFFDCRGKDEDLAKEGKVTFADSSSSTSYEDASDVRFSRRTSQNHSEIQSYLETFSTSFRSSSEPMPEISTFVGIWKITASS